MNTFYRLFVFLILLFSVESMDASEPEAACDINNTAFKPGEKLSYLLSYTWFFVWTDVGEVTFSVNADTLDGNEALHLHTFGETYSFYDWFYKVRDTHETWVDAKTLKPIYFKLDVNQGSYTKENEYWFDWQSGIVDARIQRRGGKNNFYQIPMEDRCIYDVVSAIYMARNLDFSGIKPDQSFPLNVALDEELFNVSYRFIKAEQIKVRGAGKFNTLKFRVELVAGDIFGEGQYLYVWVTNDANRLPVYIESPIKVGKVRVRIDKWEGLKYPLNAKVE
ncbi:MAG: DUF3108 domain-containing protein [Bacteroidales bacterium]